MKKSVIFAVVMRRVCLLSILFCLFPFMCAGEENGDDKGRFLDAVTLYGRGEFEASSKVLDSLYNTGSVSDAVCYYLGLCEAARGNAANSVKMLQEAVSRDTLNVWYLSALASVYEAGEQWLPLAHTCEQLIKLDPAHFAEPYFYAKTGNAFSQAREPVPAAEYLDRALAIMPDMPMALFNRAGVALIREEYENFFEFAGRLMRVSELDADWKYKYLSSMVSSIPAQTLQEWKEPMLQLCASACDTHPDYLRLHVFRQGVAYVVKDYRTVISEAEKIISLSGGDEDTFESMTQLIGDAYMELGDQKSCFAAYEKVLKHNPGSIVTLNNYAYALSLAGKNLGKALKMSARVIADSPENATYLDTYGWILHRMGRNAGAKEVFQRAMLFGGRNEKVILSHYAEVLRALGDNDLAAYYESLAAK